MKVLLILVVIAGLVYYFFFYKKAHEEVQAPVAAESPVPQPTVDPNSFDAVSALLRQDLDAIPAALDGPEPAPVNAIAVKRKLRPYLALHQEYQTLTRACDLIIDASAKRTTFQQSCRFEQDRTEFSNALEHDTSRHSAYLAGHVPVVQTPPPEDQRKAIHERVANTWLTYRTQQAEQVQRLLGSLAGHHL
jgi:hypothetical protein